MDEARPSHAPLLKGLVTGFAALSVAASALVVSAPWSAKAVHSCAPPAASFGPGDGQASPYVIDSNAELELLRDDTTYWDDNFILGADLSLSQCSWDSGIGDSETPFTGVFDGNEHAISDLMVSVSGDFSSQPNDGVAGLFGWIGSGGEIRDLAVSGSVEARVDGSQVFAGGVAGRAIEADLVNVSFEGTVIASGLTDNPGSNEHPYAGGILGQGLDVRLGEVNADVSVEAVGYWRPSAGGLVGSFDRSSPSVVAHIVESWAVGTVLSDGFDQSSAGGLVGASGDIQISNSYALVDVTAGDAIEPAAGGVVGYGRADLVDTFAQGVIRSPRFVGGLVGWAIQDDSGVDVIENSYFTGVLDDSGAASLSVGGIAGHVNTQVNDAFQAPNSFWDTSTTGIPVAAGTGEYIFDPTPVPSPVPVSGAQGAPQDQMRSVSTFAVAGWNIVAGFGVGATWSICAGFSAGYPYLSSFVSADPCLTPTPSPTPTPTPIATQPPRPDPPGAPAPVLAQAGDRSAEVTWGAPLVTGSGPVTEYETETFPAGNICRALPPTTSCKVTGLSNGSSYVFRVRAKSYVGWGSWSEYSNMVTPKGEASIVITGSRGRDKPRTIRVSGTTTGLTGSVTPWLRLGSGQFKAEPAVRLKASGTFRWSAKTSAAAQVYVRHGSVRSNTVTIRAR